jgi:uncharacterized protein YfcZ (UPF0381/DUF406 family)
MSFLLEREAQEVSATLRRLIDTARQSDDEPAAILERVLDQVADVATGLEIELAHTARARQLETPRVTQGAARQWRGGQ